MGGFLLPKRGNTMNELKSFLKEHKAEMKAALSDLVACESVRGEPTETAPFGEGVKAALDTFLALCEKNGLTTRNVDNYVGVAEIGDQTAPLGILCHLDVVPAGEGWESDPFTLTEKGGFLYGRGAIDDKGPAVAVLYALLAVLASGKPLVRGVRLIAGCAEETGWEDMDYYTAREPLPKLLFTPDAEFPVIHIEKGRVQGKLTRRFEPTAAPKAVTNIDAGVAVNAVPERATATLRGFSGEALSALCDKVALPDAVTFEVAEDGDYTVLTVFGKAAHASTPEEGVNALCALLRILSSLPLDECDGADGIRALSRLFPVGETDGTSLGVCRRDEVSGALTASLDTITFTEDKMKAEFDIRFPVCESLDGMKATLALSAEREGFSLSATGAEPHHVPEESPLVQTLLGVYEQVTGEPGYAVAIGGGTYVHDTKSGVAFGAEFPGDDNRMHAANERVETDKWMKTALIYARAIEEICCE